MPTVKEPRPSGETDQLILARHLHEQYKYLKEAISEESGSNVPLIQVESERHKYDDLLIHEIQFGEHLSPRGNIPAIYIHFMDPEEQNIRKAYLLTLPEIDMNLLVLCFISDYKYIDDENIEQLKTYSEGNIVRQEILKLLKSSGYVSKEAQSYQLIDLLRYMENVMNLAANSLDGKGAEAFRTEINQVLENDYDTYLKIRQEFSPYLGSCGAMKISVQKGKLSNVALVEYRKLAYTYLNWAVDLAYAYKRSGHKSRDVDNWLSEIGLTEPIIPFLHEDSKFFDKEIKERFDSTFNEVVKILAGDEP